MEGFEYKVRFHLQRGQHYMHWQIKAYDGTVKYIDPNKYQLELYGCKLINKININDIQNLNDKFLKKNATKKSLNKDNLVKIDKSVAH